MKTIHRNKVWVLKVKDYDLNMFQTILCAVNETFTEATNLATGESFGIKVKPYPKEQDSFQSARPKYKERYFLTTLTNEARGLVSEFAQQDGKWQDYVLNNEILSIAKIKQMQSDLNHEFNQAKQALETESTLTLSKK